MGIFTIYKDLSREELTQGIRNYIIDGICSIGMTTLQAGIYLTAFAIALDATPPQIGLIASFAFFSQLMQLPGLFIATLFTRRKTIILPAVIVSRLLWVPIILWAPVEKNGLFILIVFLLISSLIGAIPGPAWNSLIRDLLPIKKLGNINGKRIMLSSVLAMVLTLAGGYFIDWWKTQHADHHLYAYSIIFGLGLFLGLLGTVAITRMPEPVNTSHKVPLKELIRLPLKDKNFRQLIIFLTIWNFAFNISMPFFIVYMINRIELSIFYVTLFTVMGQLVTILFLKIWGKLSDHFSNKSVLLVSCPMFLIVVILWTFTAMPNPHELTFAFLIIIHILHGISLAGVSIGTGNIALKLSPQELTHGYMTVVGLTTSIMGGVAPIIGGILGTVFTNIQIDIPVILTVNKQQSSLPILNFKGLDFLFLVTFVVGLYSLHRLSLINEEGDVGKREILDNLKVSVTLPLRTMANITGMQRIAAMPVSGLMHLSSKVMKKVARKKAARGEQASPPEE